METSETKSVIEVVNLQPYLEPNPQMVRLHHGIPTPNYTDIKEKTISKFLLIYRLKCTLGYLLLMFLIFSFLWANAQPLSVTVTSTNVFCGGENTGSATATAMGGIPPYFYSWSNWETTATINNLYAGTYDVTITDDSLSSVEASVTIIDINPPLYTLAVITSINCYGGSDGSIATEAGGGEPPYLYNWSNGSTNPIISNLTVGLYSLTVSDDNDCLSINDFYVYQPPDITIELVELNSETCLGAEDGSIEILVFGGVNPLNAEWSNGHTGLSISDLSSGLYTVTVTDNNDCTKTASFFIDPGSVLNVNLLQIQHVSCNGESDGAVQVNATGNMPPFTYIWSNGMTTPNIEELSAGTYVLTTTDANECEVVTSYTINEPPDLLVSITQTSQNLCFGDMNADLSANASGGTPGYTALWSNGTEGMNNNNLAAGTYTVTVTDNHDCTKTATAIVTAPAELAISLVDLIDETCAGAEDGSITIEVSGGVSPFLAEWSNGLEGLYISDLSPGTYTVTVTDNNGCSDISSFSIDPGAEVIITLLQLQNISCHGGSNGAISLTASGGSSPYTYLWSNGMSGPSISGLPAATYTSTVTDVFGCTDVSTYVLSEPTAISVSIVQTAQNPCFGDTLADLSANVSGGTPAYSGLWSDNATGLENTNLAAGVYTITVTDANMCVSTQTATIIDPALLSTSVSTTNETGNDANDGTATAVPGGGTPTYSYLWSNGGTTSTITGLPPGSYTVTINDQNGCIVTGTEQVLAFGCTLDVMAGTDYPICENDTSVITPLVLGASGNVTYLWTDGSTGESLQVSQGGEYCVTVTDEGNCQNGDCIVITVNSVPPFTCPVTDESVPDANDGAIQCDSLSGNMSYAWSNGAMTASISGLSPGEYCVTITDSIGCSRTQCFNIQPANCLVTLSSEVTHVSCHGQATGVITLSLTGIIEPVTYSWSNGATSSAIDQLTAGDYAVTIVDAAGCVDNGSFTITEPQPITIRVDSIAPADLSGSGFIGITVSGGTPSYTYQWLDPAGGIMGNEDLNGLVLSGYYFLVVTDAAGCMVRLDSVFVDQGVSVENQIPFKAFRVYPVPADDMLYIDFEGTITALSISGVDGRIYKKIINPGTNKIDISDIGPGWYVLKIDDGIEWHLGRMVK